MTLRRDDPQPSARQMGGVARPDEPATISLSLREH